jgi:hypothetical protein
MRGQKVPDRPRILAARGVEKNIGVKLFLHIVNTVARPPQPGTTDENRANAALMRRPRPGRPGAHRIRAARSKPGGPGEHR